MVSAGTGTHCNPCYPNITQVTLPVEKVVISVDVPELLLSPMPVEQSTRLFTGSLELRDVLPLIIRYAVYNDDGSAVSLLCTNKSLYNLWTRDHYISKPLLPGKLMLKHQWAMHDWIMNLARRSEYNLHDFMPVKYKGSIRPNMRRLYDDEADMNLYWKPTFVISAPTGTGKTVAIFSSALTMMADEPATKHRFLIVSPPTVADTMYRQLYRELYGPDDSIAVLYGKVDPDMDLTRYRFIIVSSYIIGRKQSKINKLIQDCGKFRCVYVDEYDCSVGENGVDFLNSIDTPMRIMMSASGVPENVSSSRAALFGFTDKSYNGSCLLEANRGYSFTVNGNHTKVVKEYTRYEYTATGVWFPSYPGDSEDIYYNRDCGTGALLLQVLRQRPHTVLYCTNKRHFAIISGFLTQAAPDLTVYPVNGSSVAHHKQIERFTQSDTGVLLTITSSAARGINLHGVVDTVIVIGNRSNVLMSEKQCAGRLLRLGQNKSCEIHLICLPSKSDVLVMRNAHELSGIKYWSPNVLQWMSTYCNVQKLQEEQPHSIYKSLGWDNHIIGMLSCFNAELLCAMLLDGHVDVSHVNVLREHDFGVGCHTIKAFLRLHPQYTDLLTMIFPQ